MITRGIKNDVDNFINDLQAQFFPYGKKKEIAVQLAVRPVQFWELVFPEESLPDMLKMLEYHTTEREEVMGKIAWIRRALKAEKIPDIDLSQTPKRFIRHKNLATYFIGLKKDKKFPKGKMHEGLDVGECEAL